MSSKKIEASNRNQVTSGSPSVLQLRRSLRLALASGCIIQYVGHVCFLAGTMAERRRAKVHLIFWVLFFFGCCPSFFDHCFFLLILVLLVSLLFYLHLSSLSFLPSFFPFFLSFFLLPLLLSFFLSLFLACPCFFLFLPVALLLLSVVLFLLLGVVFALCFRDSHGPQLG